MYVQVHQNNIKESQWQQVSRVKRAGINLDKVSLVRVGGTVRRSWTLSGVTLSHREFDINILYLHLTALPRKT